MRWYIWLFAVIVAVLSFILLPDGGKDWSADIAPAARCWWDAPWSEGLPLPPYAAALLAPIAWLPFRLATAMINGASVIALSKLAQRWEGPQWVVVLVLLTPAGYWLFRTGQTDALILAGILLPAGWGVPIYTLKPQAGAWITVAHVRCCRWTYWLPIVLILFLSLIIWGWWPKELWKYSNILIPADWNSSLWPYSLPVGLWLGWRAFRTNDERYGVLASPLLFPYVNMSTYLGSLIVLGARYPKATLCIWLLVWLAGVLMIFM